MGRALIVLVAEDDPNDALLLKLALDQACVKAWLHFVGDGHEAIDYLRGEPPFDDRLWQPPMSTSRHPQPFKAGRSRRHLHLIE